MIKQIIHIILFTLLTVTLLTTIAQGQEFTYRLPEQANPFEDTGVVHEEILEYIYKFDLPAEEKTQEMSFDELPSAVKNNYLQSQYESCKVVKVFRVEQKKGNTFMVLRENNGYIETIHYNARGRQIEDLK
jgi:hypothetical protein